MKNQSGVTLFELMCALSLTAILFSTIMAVEGRLFRYERVVDGYVSDVRECRRALGQIETDLRESGRVVLRPQGFRIESATRVIDYRLERGVLTRSVDGETRPAGRRIESVDLRPRGRLVDVAIRLESRQAGPGSAAGVLATTIRMQGAAR